MTNPDTVSEVFHLAETRSRSRKKNTVDAINAIEINQNEMPTKSSGLRVEDAAADALVLNSASAAPDVAIAVALDQIRLVIMRVSLKMHDRLILKGL